MGRLTIPSWNARITYCGSVFAMTKDSAAAASRGVSGVPATAPEAIEPDTSSPMYHRLPVGATVPKAK